KHSHFLELARIEPYALVFYSMKSPKSPASALRSSNRSYTIRSVARAAATLKAFSSSSEVLSLTTIVERTQLDKGTAFRLLETLVEAGLIIRAGKHGYQSAI